MASPTPISPPVPPNVAPAPSSTSVPISPVSRSNTFPHKTSPAVSSQTTLIDTNTPAINAAPVELDGVPMELSGVTREGVEEESAGAEQRAAMLASRSKDPGVIVDVPKEPTAEEVEAAKSADGTVTPGIGAGREIGV